MKIEINVTDEMEDEIVLESLKWHFEAEKSYRPKNLEDKKINWEIVEAFKIIVDYYGG